MAWAKKTQRSAINAGACNSAAQAQGQVAALVRAHSCSASGSTNKPSTKAQRTLRSASWLAPWKNSRVLKAPADMPMDFCTNLRAGMPVADCSVDIGRSAALRRRLCQRISAASIVDSVVQGASAASNAPSPADAASAQASAPPEARPIKVKLATVLQCAHSWMKRRQA